MCSELAPGVEVWWSEGTWIASRARTPTNLQYEPRIGILQYGYAYVPHVGLTGWLPTEIMYLPSQNHKTSTEGAQTGACADVQLVLAGKVPRSAGDRLNDEAI